MPPGTVLQDSVRYSALNHIILTTIIQVGMINPILQMKKLRLLAYPRGE